MKLIVPKDVLIHQLISMRAQVDSMLSILTSDEQYPDECSHPKERLMNLTTLGGPEHWICKDCDFEYRGDE